MIAESIMCTAVAIYFEARAETFYGQLQVANVIQNRVNSTSYPDEHCDVILQDKQFSFLNDASPDNQLHIKNHNAFITAYAAAQYYFEHKPKYNDACHYATIETNNNWTLEFDMIYATKGHSFYEGGC